MDFVLWKAAKPGEPAWDSPWGRGRPGWHIECSAMSIADLGEQFDIHGGGQDVIFPHHENEVAQSEGYTGKHPFVRVWVHNGLLRLSEGEEKMTRHLGNIVSIREALERYHPDTIRVFVLSSHYRSPTTWGEDALAAAARGAERLRTALENAEDLLTTAGGVSTPPRPGRATAGSEGSGAAKVLAALGTEVSGASAHSTRNRFEAAMDDDFNTPGALASLFDLASAMNRVTDAASKGPQRLPQEDRETLRPACAVLRELGGILGLRLEASVTSAQITGLVDLARELSKERPELFTAKALEFAGPLAAGSEAGEDHRVDVEVAGKLVEYIAGGRMQARRRRDWTTGDRIRTRLADLGILVEDTPTGFKWRVR